MVEINGYSREKDGGRLLSTHFKVREFEMGTQKPAGMGRMWYW